MGEHEQMQNYERMIKKYQLLKNDNLRRVQEHPQEKDAILRANAKIDEEIVSIQRVMENIKQKQLREAKFRPVQRAVPQDYAPEVEEKSPQEKKLREISHNDFAKMEPPANNEFLKAVQAKKKETIEGTAKPPKDLSGSHADKITKEDPTVIQKRSPQERRVVSILDEEDEK